MSPTITARQAFAAWNERVAGNAVDADPHLQSLARHHGRSAALDGLRAFGAISADRLDKLVRESNRDENLPRLRRYDAIGRRTEGVDFHPSYHEIGRLAYATGAMSLYAQPGREWETLAYEYLLAQNGEAGHACPFACTAGLIKILQHDQSGAWPAEWLERLLDPNYDTHFHGAQFLTEVQGGSDVGANSLRAVQDADGWRLYGEKWFCSVIDAHLWLVTARPDGSPAGTRGLLAFAVPRTLPDGETNAFNVRRLKFKLGTKSMASAELDFLGAKAWPVGDFRTVVELVLDTSRVYNAICSSGILQRAYREAHAYAAVRTAFGQPILAFPAVARTVAKIRTEAYAARGHTFAIAALADRQSLGQLSPAEQAALRVGLNLNKYWTSHVATAGVKDAIELFGGNGAIEEFTVLPRLLRDSIVCEAWEGGHNVLCAQVLRDSQRLKLHGAYFDWIAGMLGADPELDRVRERFERVLALPDLQAAAHIRDVVDELRPIAQAAALTAEMRTEGHDPLLPTVIAHLRTIHRRGWDPMDDATLAERIGALVA